MSKILILSMEYPPATGGAGVIAQDIAVKLVRNNFDVTVVTNYLNRVKTLEFELIEVKTIPKLRFISLWNRIRKLPLESYQKIIINDIGASMVAAFFFGEELRKKSIILLHGSEPEKIFVKPSLLFKVIGFKNKYLGLLEHCSVILSVSKYMKKKFLDYTKAFELEEKIKVVYNGIDENVFYNEPINLHQKFNIDTDAKLLLTVGRIVKGKGHLQKLKIFRKIIQQSNYHWIIVGDGSFKDELVKLVRNYKLEDRVHFVGRVDRNELKYYYSSVDYFWLLSDFEESLGLVYLEAQFCKTPAIGNNNSGVREVIINNKTGYLVDSPEELISKLTYSKVFNDADFSEIIEKFSFQNNTEKLLEWL